MAKEIHLAVFISGGGSTMEKILEACSQGKLPNVIPKLVIASKQCGGIAKALQYLPADRVVIVSPKEHRTSFGDVLQDVCEKAKVGHAIQCGWLPTTPWSVLAHFEGNIFNQHPAPLDSSHIDFGGEGMYGMRAHCARLYFARKSGMPQDQYTEATIHRAVFDVDQGEVVARKRISILPTDSPESLQKRLLPFEHRLVLSVLRRLNNGEKLKPLGRRTPVVNQYQHGLLREAKEVGIMLYPKG
jgi:phosphoribosylglycinamide formyltransferase 1